MLAILPTRPALPGAQHPPLSPVWLRYDLDFRDKYSYAPTDRPSSPAQTLPRTPSRRFPKTTRWIRRDSISRLPPHSPKNQDSRQRRAEHDQRRDSQNPLLAIISFSIHYLAE